MYNLRSQSSSYTQGNTKGKSGMPDAYTQVAKLFKVYVFLTAPFMHNWKDVCSNMSFPQNIWMDNAFSEYN